MPIHTDSLQIDQAHAALARAVSQSPALCNLWRLEDGSAPERAASYRFVFASHDVDPNTGVDYGQLVGKRFDECFPTVDDTELPAAMAALRRTNSRHTPLHRGGIGPGPQWHGRNRSQRRASQL